MAMTDEERKSKRRAYAKTDEVKAKQARYRTSEPYKERVKANLPSYVTHLAARDNDRAWMLEESPEDVAQEYMIGYLLRLQ